MELNQSIVDFNSEQIKQNNSLLNGNLQPAKASETKNKNIIENNNKIIKELEKRAKSNKERMHDLLATSKEYSNSILEIKNVISARRSTIMKNKETIIVNKSKIFINSK